MSNSVNTQIGFCVIQGSMEKHESIPSLWPPVLGHCGMRVRTEVRCVVCKAAKDGGARVGVWLPEGEEKKAASRRKGRRRDREERDCLCGVGGWVDRCDWWKVRCVRGTSVWMDQMGGGKCLSLKDACATRYRQRGVQSSYQSDLLTDYWQRGRDSRGPPL